MCSKGVSMPGGRGEKLIFSRYTREECGLPPVEDGKPRRHATAIRVCILLAVLAVAGWAGGIATARWREAWLGSLPGLVSRAEPGERAELLARGRVYATALRDRPDAARNLAIAGIVAAGPAPRRLGYYANVANLLDRAGSGASGSPEVDFASDLAASGAYAELGRYSEAFARLGRADAALKRIEDENRRRSYQLLLVNAQAYYLATAPREAGRNPEKSLHLAQLLVSSRDKIADGGHASGSAAFLDTLASAWFATGDDEQAAKTQVFALGLADTGDLDVYLRHYDEFSADSAGRRDAR